ncbi:hypothetical protein AN639_03135 [Candidatus Epulonipiscium fishelsonii]|uniref:Uncharacterized protein n=1 Tax=Candidatus Epulonipiscium fishelsonii TaxID=77094 RepID=A0ACC8XG70_9FIRM|nr:hypothetical protein AN639_03135 [Epulopiscium sp. SCG-B05WGA-EpuloA1]ONI42610.1 hypothetical protein AN396_13590 [Epulopiscium sp. SCG-B11WGA-EpuloA1]
MFKIFFKKKNTPEKIAFTVDQDELDKINAVVEHESMPIIILDNNWYVVKQIIADKEIDKLEKIVHTALKKQGQVNTDLIEYGKIKQVLLDKILRISEQIHSNPELIKDLDQASDALVKASEHLISLEQEVIGLDDKLEKANLDLVKYIVNKSYGLMSNQKYIRETLEKEIDELRSAMLEKTAQKKSIGIEYSILYNYFHNLIGHQYVNKLDNIIDEIEENKEKDDKEEKEKEEEGTKDD